VLRLANLYSGTQSIEAVVFFARTVAELSAGEVRVKFVHAWGRADDPSEETTLLADVASGRVELGWVGTRAFGKLGVRSLDPLQAPFLITSYEAEAAACRSHYTQQALVPLTAIGLQGIAVLGGELRKPFGITRVLVGASDYEGARIRTHASAVGEETFRALGAVPLLRSRIQMARRDECTFDGMDNHCGAIASWGYRGTLTTNVNLWPRTVTLIASCRTWQRLGADEQRALRKAGERAAEFAATALARQERADLEVLQGASVDCVKADADQLADLRDRVAPAYDSLRRDPPAAAYLKQLEEILGRPGGN
jgi:TRAP-type C4-dicarboxylate transport system substrate-binding protein